jgi:aerobic-type carbon monoxide dehydrogenase small subunit (CoxS/CutS family)
MNPSSRRGPVDPLPVDVEGRITLALRVNGRTENVRARANHTILQVLRDELDLVAVREGCGVGMCGACTILVDGKPMSSCLLLAPLAVGRDLTTLEGLESPASELDPVQQAFIDNTGFQCSYCTPGFILATKALLAEKPNVTRDEARDYLAGNLCRCGSYAKILDAVLDARDRLGGSSEDPGDAAAEPG